MDMMIKVATVAVTSVICATVLKKEAGEQSILLILMTGVVICFFLSSALEEILYAMSRLAHLAQIEQSLLTPVLKTVMISITTKITSELCRSAGEGGMASFVEMGGTLLAIVVALPLMEGVLGMMVEML